LSAFDTKVCFFIHNNTCLSNILADNHTGVNTALFDNKKTHYKVVGSFLQN
jgi:hypothetical protein